MNESILYTLAQIGVTLAGFSGVAIAFRVHGAHRWTKTELRILWFLIGDSFLVLLFSLLPVPLVLAGMDGSTVWGVCGALLGSWFIIGNLLYLKGTAQDRANDSLIVVPIITPIFHVIMIGSFLMGATLWLSAIGIVVPRSQAVYVLGLITLLVFAAIEFLFFIGVISQQNED